mmetsp:Transcript_43706/g.72636  ORF Transcript_43706/g.72636 Transcript_43706/m.72636 type:complete len:90 (+) Transcript_43706:1-270(+)
MVAGSAVASEPSRSLVMQLARTLPPADAFALERRVQGLQFGSGMDYVPMQPTPMDAVALARAKEAASAARAFAAARASDCYSAQSLVSM